MSNPYDKVVDKLGDEIANGAREPFDPDFMAAVEAKIAHEKLQKQDTPSVLDFIITAILLIITVITICSIAAP